MKSDGLTTSIVDSKNKKEEGHNKYEEETPTTEGESSSSSLQGGILLIVALLVFSSQGSVFVLLNRRDANVYSSCNVLCAASTYGLVFVLLYFTCYKRTVNLQSFKDLKGIEWVYLLSGSTLYSTVGPYLFLLGLESVSVPLASIMQRLESLNFLLLSYLFLGAKITSWTLASSCWIVLGVCMGLFWPAIVGEESRAEVPVGCVLIMCGGYAYSTSLLISKKYLARINTGVVTLTRVGLGTLLFHALNVTLGASDSLGTGKLWVAMLPYSIVYIFLGQICWNGALKTVPPLVLSLATNLLFVLALIWAAIILATFPNQAAWVGAACIMIGLISSALEILYRATQEEYEHEQQHQGKQQSEQQSKELALIVTATSSSDATVVSQLHSDDCV